jgi:hypothetical protein
MSIGLTVTRQDLSIFTRSDGEVFHLVYRKTEVHHCFTSIGHRQTGPTLMSALRTNQPGRRS